MTPQAPTPKPNQQPTEEKLEFLKRDEVRTMAKDMALLREEEAKKERERITRIKAEEPKKKISAPAQAPKPQPISPSLMPHTEAAKPVFLRARTRSEKIIIRAIVIGILLFILLNGLAFGYWYFTRKKVVEIIPAPAEQEVESQPTGGDSTSAQIEVKEPPVVFFEPAQEKTIEVATTDNLISLLSNAIKEEYPQGFTRIRLQHTENAAPLTTGEFLEKAAVVMPSSLSALLHEDFMLFAYASPGRKRLGMIAELTQIADTEQSRSTEGVQDMLRNWETTLEQDTKSLWEVVGQKGSAYAPSFRQTTYKNISVRFQTFSVLDFGVVYGLSDTKLILATSFESLTRAIDLLLQNR
jgi:outer membrane biosynthesis protein TonB